MTPSEEAQEFLKIAPQFQLGMLDTEKQHPLTPELSAWAKDDLVRAIEALHAVDLQALHTWVQRLAPAQQLAQAIATTLQNKGRIFICGCGATGRLALSLEVFCRQGMLEKQDHDRVIAFMAGGDAALIRSIEHFEDHPEFGARQLTELGFREGDLLISSTEGGETPFVIGATEEATRLSSIRPWFLYCNPEDQLVEKVERSRQILSHADVVPYNLAVGPMGIAGSTRMQASTILMATIGLALQHHKAPEKIQPEAEAFCRWMQQVDFSFLAPYTQTEAALYAEGKHVLYTTKTCGMTVLTDTTERSPTFSLLPFENTRQAGDPQSLCYLTLAETKDSPSAWDTLLTRAPRTLEWEDIQAPTHLNTLLGFDISEQAHTHRQQAEKKDSLFSIELENKTLALSFTEHSTQFALDALSPLCQQLFLKMLLNTHSTLVMGRLARYEGNLMTYVKPSNNKLIDRSIRYVQILFERATQRQLPYETAAEALFAERLKLNPGEPIVLKTLKHCLQPSAERPDTV